METKDTLDNEKKVYTTPKLLEYGNLIETTQDGNRGPDDGFGGSSWGGIIAP